MLVENTTTAVLGPSVPYGAAPMQLRPGNNEVDDKAWDYAKKSKFVKSRLPGAGGKLAGQLIEHKPKAAEKAPAAAADANGDSELAKLNQMKALEVIKGTFDLELLHKWAAADTRKKVSAALAKQIAIIDKGRDTPPEA